MALFLLGAPVFAQTDQTVIATLKIHADLTTKIAYNWNWSGPGSITGSGTRTEQASDQLTWSADDTETYQCSWAVEPDMVSLACSQQLTVSNGASVHGGGSASEQWAFSSCVDGNGQGQANWNPDYDAAAGLFADADWQPVQSESPARRPFSGAAISRRPLWARSGTPPRYPSIRTAIWPASRRPTARLHL
jgi:hypothetical protein